MSKKHAFISEDDQSFHVYDGKKNFLVAKKGLKEDLHEKIRSLPKYASGGMVAPGDPVSLEAKPKDTRKLGEVGPGIPDWLSGKFDLMAGTDKPKVSKERVMEAMANPNDPFAKNYPGELESAAKYYGMAREPQATAAPTDAAAPVETPAEIVANTPIPSPEAVAQKSQNIQQANAMMPVIQDLKTGTAMQAAGIQAEANAATKLADEQFQTFQKMYSPEREKQQQERLEQLQAKALQLDKEGENLYEAAFNNKVDPRRVWNNMSSGNKVMATIAIILGGMGSGGNAENNAALKVINKAIDDDINAQMKNGENAKQLYQLNLQKYRDTQTAIDATRAQMTAIAQGQLASLASKYGGESAQARAQGLMGALKKQQAQDQAAVMAKFAEATGKADERYIPGYGQARVKPTDKDRDTMASIASIKNGLTKLQARAAKIGTTVPGSAADEESKTFAANLKLQIKDAYQLGALSEGEHKILDSIVADPGGFKTGNAIKKLEATKQALDLKEKSILNKLGVDIPSQSDGKIRVSDGKQTFAIDPSDLSAAQKDGFKRVQ